MPQAERAKIFEAFSQGGSGRDARQIGAGLGLAIATRLAEAMGGRLGVGGVEGEGADFWFEATFETGGEAAAADQLAGRTVAVASPSAIVREAAARQIESSGGRAIRARRIEEALARTDEGAVILVDHLLAGAGAMLTPPPGRASVVLLRPEDRGRIAPCRAAGFDGYLIKPLRRASLVERVLAARVSAAGQSKTTASRRAGRPRSAPPAACACCWPRTIRSTPCWPARC